MSKKLIVNADDYGRAPGVSRGILQALTHPAVQNLGIELVTFDILG